MPNPATVFRPNANALITGGASGVGLAVAKLCASHGMNVTIVDNNSLKLDEAKTTISSNASVQIHAMDVSSLDEWATLKATVEQGGKKLDFIHLNAGIGLKGDWADSTYFHKIFDDNNGEGKAIIVTGSKQGITNPPGNPAYNATKSAVKTIAEHLSFDLAKSSPSTSVHLLVPGWTFTGMTGGGGLKEKPDGAWAPEQVAHYLYKKMSDGKFYVVCPDNDVDWETDRKRMTWSMGDVVFERLPQSRWREEYKDEANETMNAMKLGSKQKD